MKGQEAIQELGRTIIPHFNLESEERISIYRQVYELFTSYITKESGERIKAVFVVGSIGVGKSILMRISQRLFKDTPAAFKWVYGYDLGDMLEGYSTSEIKAMYGKDLKMDLYIDDIGVGSSVHNKYGNHVNIISEIICERYDLYVSEGYRTHLSSNKPVSVDKEKYPKIVTLMDLYGDRVVDRINEMCEVIKWNGQSLRK